MNAQTRNRTQPSFRNKYQFLQKIDELEVGPEWSCDEWTIKGDIPDEDGKMKTEDLELWRRDTVACVAELLGNPVFQAYLKYAPEKLFENADGTGRIYADMFTADWWWEIQVSI